MVLTKRIFIGLFLLALLTCTTTSSTLTRRHRQVSTVTPKQDVTTTATTTTTTTKEPHKPLPKTENETTKTNPQALLSSTTKSPEVKQNQNEETKKRQDSGRSLDINHEKYLSPEYHSENNVYSESKVFEKEVSKPMEYEQFFDQIDMTTPKDNHFDQRHKELRAEMSKTMEERDRLFDDDDGYTSRRRFEDIKPEFRTTPMDESDMNVRGYKQIDSSESRVKNKVHMDYNVEEGKKMDMIKSYNETKIIPEPKNDDKKPDALQTSETKNTGDSVKQVKTTLKPNRGVRTHRNQSKPLDLAPESSIQISNIHIQAIDPNLIKILNDTNNQLTKEQLDPIVSNDKEILINKRGKSKQKTIPVGNLDELNVVEVTTIMKKDHESTTESMLKIQKLASMDMKTVDAIISKESIVPTTKVVSTTPEEITLEVASTTDVAMTTAIEVLFKETTPLGVTEATTLDVTEATTLGVKDTITVGVTEATTLGITEVITLGITDTSTLGFTDATTLGVTEATTLGVTETTITDETTPGEVTEGTTGNTTGNSEEITTELQTTEYATTTSPFVFDEDMTNFRGLIEDLLTNSTEVPLYETTVKFFEAADNPETTFYEVSSPETTTEKQRNDSNLANEIIKIEPTTTTTKKETFEISNDLDNTTSKINDNDIIRQNEINTNSDKVVKSSTTEESIEKECEAEPCETEHDEDYIEAIPKKTPDIDELDENPEKLDKFGLKMSIEPTKPTTPIPTTIQTVKINTYRNVVSSREEIEVDVTTIPSGLTEEEDEGGNGGKIAAIVISSVGGVCLVLLVGLLVIMRKRQKRFNYGKRCRPVSLDAYNMDNVSIHNSTRRKGVLMASKRSYGNPAFEDPNCPSHLLSYPDLSKFAKSAEEVYLEFEKIPQVHAKTSELPEGCDAKNRYANVIPLPETRVYLTPIDGHPNSDYINANYVAGAKGQRRYYIACQAPMLNTIDDFWRMVWEQESKVILMLTHLYEQGVEKCIDYLPPSEVLDCHRLFGDFQVTLKKREVRDKYIISSLQLKNMVSNSWREVTHMWYMDWPHKGVPEETNSIIRYLIEARSYIKSTENKTKEENTSFINGSARSGSSPVVVHCSPGTGRTGTVIACDIAIREFEMTRNVDIPKIVYKIRRDRASSVQTKDQYSYIYNVINLYATKLTGGAFDSF